MICEYLALKALMMGNLLLGLDIGSSSIKASIVDVKKRTSVASCQSPDDEMKMLAVQPGWAEQDPELWWEHSKIAISKCLERARVDGREIEAIGISYQMHGLVLVDKDHRPIRPSIIWCDSRAVDIGQTAFEKLGEEYCLMHFLNSPGNFTASKLMWVKQNEPALYQKIHKFMLPGDFIALKLTGEIATTDTGLSEGVFWDYSTRSVAQKLIDHYGFDESVLPKVDTVFSIQGRIREKVARELGIREGIPVSYRAGDQPNNAFSLNVVSPGETAATAGTSGVIYSVTDKNIYDPKNRVNTFIHVNNNSQRVSNGVLLCVNGTGILNSWLRKNLSHGSDVYSYDEMNRVASTVPIGSDGLFVLPFGNGAERVLQNQKINASFIDLDFNQHTRSHLLRASQEGIVFALRYGFDVLKSLGLNTSVIRAGYSNMFLSPLFREAFVNTIGAPLQLFKTDGATGAAIGAGVGAGLFDVKEAFKGLSLIEELSPDRDKSEQYEWAYQRWKQHLEKELTTIQS
jgi:xylulokinase